tara:strand:+ start:35240 stop:35869 length:630 start_codon:yes stop_codon:yes gene_type:complete
MITGGFGASHDTRTGTSRSWYLRNGKQYWTDNDQPVNPPSNVKLMVMGHARHGKDTVCEILRDRYGLKFRSSSEAACDLVIYPVLKLSHGYRTIEECFNDRHNHRELWHHLIWQHNRQDHANLARAIYAENDVYCGMRHIGELRATRAAGLFHFAIWVNRDKHQPPEDASSCSVTPADADYQLDNNGTLEDLVASIDRMMAVLTGQEAA